MSLSVYRGRQIKDVSHFRGCKSASGDGSGVSDASNPPSAASTYRLPIHVASKATLQTSRIIKCPQKSSVLSFQSGSHPIPSPDSDFYLVSTLFSAPPAKPNVAKNKNRLKLEYFRVYQL